MYMPDAIKATMQIMEAESHNVKLRVGYNVGAFSFTPEELAMQIRKSVPDFKIQYNPDFRQQVAEGWPSSIDDSCARKDWGWKNDYSFEQMVTDMLEHLSEAVS